MIDTAKRPCGSWKKMNAARYTDASPLRPYARNNAIQKATWFAITYPIVQPDSRASCTTAGFRHSNTRRKLAPARRRAGSSTSAIATMPAVVPRPSRRISPVLLFTVSTFNVWSATTGNAMNTAMTTRLLSTGANAAAANRRRALSIAVASAVRP